MAKSVKKLYEFERKQHKLPTSASVLVKFWILMLKSDYSGFRIEKVKIRNTIMSTDFYQ